MEQITNFFFWLVNELEKHATFILVIITAIYVVFTAKMAKTMNRQVAFNIRIKNIIIGSVFEEKWFRERLEKSEDVGSHYFDFKLYFEVFNRGGGGGSIEKPKLLLKFSNKEFFISPTTKEEITVNKERTETGMVLYDNKIIDLGGSIYLRGGDLQRVEIEYQYDDTSEELLKIIHDKSNSPQYFIKYEDTFSKEYLIKVENIIPESELDIP